jgi:hypothetical protein
VLLSLVLIEILVLLKEPALVQTIAPVTPNMRDQTALILFAMEKVLSLLEFVLEMVCAILQIIVFVYPMDIQVHFAILLFVQVLEIVLEMVYVLVQIIALALLDGKIQIVVHLTVILSRIVLSQKVLVQDQINAIVPHNGQEMIAIVLFATQSVL